MTPEQIIEVLRVAYVTYGWLGLVGVGASIALQIYKEPFIQSRLPAPMQWATMRKGTKLGLSFGVAALSGGLLASAGSASLLASVMAAITAGVAALSFHGGAKLTGGATQALVMDPILKKLDPKFAEAVRNANGAAIAPDYVPSPFSRAVSAIVPMPRIEAVKEAARLAAVAKQ